jgi:hypothetical protein
MIIPILIIPIRTESNVPETLSPAVIFSCRWWETQKEPLDRGTAGVGSVYYRKVHAEVYLKRGNYSGLYLFISIYLRACKSGLLMFSPNILTLPHYIYVVTLFCINYNDVFKNSTDLFFFNMCRCVSYMIPPVLRLSTGMSIQNLINKDTTESKGLIVYSHYFIIMLKNRI